MVMAWRFFFLGKPLLNPNPKFPKPRSFSTSFLITKTPNKHKPKRPKSDSPRTRPVTPDSNKIPQFESLLDRDATFRFLTKTKEFLSKQSEQILRLDDAGKLHRELGFPRGRKVARSIARHPLLFTTHRHSDNKIWLGFTDLMDQLLLEETSIMEAMEEDRVTKICKLLMMSKNKRIPLSKIYHKRLIFGIPEDFRDKIGKYTDYFRLVVEDDGKQVLELVNWDPSLAVSALEKEFLVNEDKVKKAFKFPVKYGKDLDLEENDVKKLNLLNTLPLVSPYSDGWKLDLWSLEAEKYRVGIIHEFLSLTLEKRALIHHIVEFKEELSLTRQTYEMLKRQPWTFYLAGTEMNWAVFLKDGYDENGNLIKKDPQVVFNEKLYKFAQMQDEELSSEFGEK
ncbi:protein ROOT PRIMORDIUM DEFECTIVE 1 [Herrania umbratica]|uniref:Protein ROOT PRIMORDIUM DEFECTIVE 1 n=1 Tax=Herrania umbratica TaxID=108875 RepID=A0A6J1AD95_9ROSI|nr:protein ROOT PRIMORDIUM DEFECTIVE 1 [Herrania umbratica]